MGGLIELVFALLIIFWGLMELRGLRRDKRIAKEKARAADAEKTES